MLAFQYRLPPLPSASELNHPELLGACDTLFASMIELNRTPVQLAGLECRAAFLLAGRHIRHRNLEDTLLPSERRWKRNVRRLLERPAFEPLLMLAAEPGATFTGHRQIDDLALAFGAQTTRTREVRTGREERGTLALYASLSDLVGWQDRVLEALWLDVNPILAGLLSYAVVLIKHPFTDGNGRFARAVFWLALLRSKLIFGPVAPLGVTVYTNPSWAISAVWSLSESGDWKTYFQSMLRLVEYSCVLAYETHQFDEPGRFRLQAEI